MQMSEGNKAQREQESVRTKFEVGRALLVSYCTLAVT